MIWAITILSILVFTTYLAFPLAMLMLANFNSSNSIQPIERNNVSRVFLLMAAHNEEKVIEQKMDSILNSNFNKERLVCFIGSDASTDKTNEIIKSYKNKVELNFFPFENRSGKPAIINEMVKDIKSRYQLNQNDLFLLTDANVIFHTEFLNEITSNFIDSKIGLVDSNIINQKSEIGVGVSESQYLKLESKIKHIEGKLWGCSMGPFGGAFMIRANLYEAVPSKFLVDDFFIFYNVLIKGKKAVLNKEAICYEAVSGNFKEEFRRKVRISAGNFQNTFYFLPYVMKVWKIHNIIFIMHKLLRWLTPLFLLTILVIASVGSKEQPILGKLVLIMISLLVGIPVLNYLLNQVNLKLKWLQGLSYLILMNVALFFGFIKFLKGIRTNVWEPTKRKVPS